ncbi:Ig-like domain-containing protein [Paenibacillus thiaminolyticus]|uniref:Bacterial surface protein n=1 Tax=Paenibacillus thiaminolyticus TaxID=49283 RepID=A0AAP9DTY6_PANTH|nr:Ig-like domain-containing protein [Paenibacillus thiaminolyticus]MCY9533777.1 Ig-like domain-containing protein [Paenibacillus thiaminolyticus]MCY9600269.1 Ig-like domain-containing protein [Paenibacillus thiaminolyticus]MCY9607828.1 Ig-like domain-containing protein [Paenibacillus thiaminolyticus]MCY9611919.1 Ig-like domain-containing protein [Paenibacillus thiaminolyticus]MCY9617861.1 Ig-like domain-containing protein [Paenibacillus thiaminolyticus]
MNPTWKKTSWLSIVLACALVIGLLPFHGAAYAADTVTDVHFESDVNPVHVIVEGQSVQLKLIGTIKGEQKDVTGLADWSSSNPAVTVDAGWVKGASKGTSEITAKYQGYTVKKTVISNYMYDDLSVRSEDTGVDIDKETTLYLGMKPNWKAFAFDNDANTENDVTADASWSSSNSSVVEVNKGKLTLKDKGEAEITVKYKGLSSKIKIKVELPYEELTLSPDKLIEFEFGDSAVNVIAKAKTKDGNLEDVTDKADWSTSDSGVAEVKDGSVKPIGVGTATITATYLGATKSVSVVVRPSYQAMRISPDKKQTMLLGDAPLQVQTFVLNSGDTQEEVTHLAEWTSSNVMAVTVEQGQVYAKAAGTATVTAKYKGLSKSVEVNVIPAIEKLTWPEEDKDKDKDGIRKMDIYMEESQSLPKVSAVTLGGDTVDVSDLAVWTSSNTGVISIKDEKMKAESRGTATLTANVRGHEISMEVTVKRKALILQSNTSEMTIVTGREQAVPDVTVIYMNGDEENVTSEVKWESSSPNLLVVNGKLKGLVASKVTLNGTYGNVKISVKVTIEEEVVRFEIEPDQLTLNVKKSQSIKVTGYYKNGKKISLGSKVDWKSDNEKIATVKGSSVKGVAIGSTVLNGEFQGQKLEVPVKVTPKLTKLIAEPGSLKLTAGQKANWKVKAIYDTGEVVDVTSSVTFVPSNTKVKVERGSVQGVSKGSTSVKLTFEGKSTSLRVSVK